MVESLGRMMFCKRKGLRPGTFYLFHLIFCFGGTDVTGAQLFLGVANGSTSIPEVARGCCSGPDGSKARLGWKKTPGDGDEAWTSGFGIAED